MVRLGPLGIPLPDDVPDDAHVALVHGKTQPRGGYQAVILDRVDDIAQTDTDYCLHGRATCAGGCGHWLWLGHTTHDLVNSGAAVPLCKPCAQRLIPEDQWTPIRRVKDHRRADGPHS